MMQNETTETNLIAPELSEEQIVRIRKAREQALVRMIKRSKDPEDCWYAHALRGEPAEVEDDV